MARNLSNASEVTLWNEQPVLKKPSTGSLHQPEPEQTDQKQPEVSRSSAGRVFELEKQDNEEIASDPTVVDWDGPDDPLNPMNWTQRRKWTAIVLVSTITFNVATASTIFAPGVPEAMREFHSDNSAAGSLLISIYIVGMAVGPLFLSPLSELYGRYHILNIANVVFLIASILCAVAVDLPMLIVFRLIMGLACAIPNTVGGGLVADLMPQEERGTALTVWIVGPLLALVIGPVVGGYLTLKAGWRWTFWLVVIMAGVSTITGFFVLTETYAPRLLELKARRLRKETGNQSLRSKFDKGQTAAQLFRLTIIRPSKMLLRSPIVLILSLCVAIVYSYMYLLFTTFTGVFEDTYGFNPGEAGLAYLGLGVGFCIGQFVVGIFKRRKVKNSSVKPEDRLPPLVLGSFLVPIGLFWYGWATDKHTHWIVPIIGISFCGIGILCVLLPVQMYLVDAYTLYAASAIAASIVVRSIFGVVIPLAGPALYRTLGLGWGNSLLGFIAIIFATASLLLLKYGESIRRNPKFLPQL